MMITRRASRIAVAAITAVAAAVLILGSSATAAPPEPGVGQGRISAFMADGDMARFVYSAVNLPEDVGLDAGAVEASFTPAGGEPVSARIQTRQPLNYQDEKHTSRSRCRACRSLPDSGLARRFV